MKFRKRIYFSFFSILIFPYVLSNVLIFLSVTDRELTLERQYILSQVRQLRSTIDYQFNKVETDFVYLSYKKELVNLRDWSENSDYREKKLFFNNFDPFSILTDYYDEAFLVNMDDNMMIDLKNKSLLPVKNSLFETKISHLIAPFQSYQDSKNLLLSEKEGTHYSTYLIKRITLPELTKDIFLFVKLSENFFKRILDDTFLVDHSYILIVNKKNDVISLRTKGIADDRYDLSQLAPLSSIKSELGPSTVNGSALLVATDESSDKNWRYYYGIEQGSVYASIFEVIYRFSLLSIVLLTIFIFIALSVMKRVYKPIKQLFEVFREDEDSPGQDLNDIEELNIKAKDLIQHNKEMQKNLSSSLRYEKEVLFKNWLSDTGTFPENLNAKVSSLRLDLLTGPDAVYCVAICHILNETGQLPLFHQRSSEDRKVFLDTYFELDQEVHCDFFLSDEKRAVFILSFSKRTIPEVVDPSQLFRVLEEVQPPFILCFSSLRTSFEDLKMAYKEAQIALDYRSLFQGKKIVHYSEAVQMKKSIHFYPFDVEQKMISMLKQTNESGTFDYFTIFTKTVQMSGISFTNTKHIYTHLVDSLLQVAKDFEISLETHLHGEYENPWEKIFSAHEAGEIEELIRTFLVRLLEWLNSEKKSVFDVLANTVKKMIEEKYHDYSLSLDSIAQELKYSTSHLSAIFKSAFGETIKDYITRVRLQRACELLASTDKRISRIALEVGYINLGSFVKIFKTYHGETPKSYKLKSAIISK